MLWFAVRGLEAELGSCMVSLLASPFPNGGSLGGMLLRLYLLPAEFGSCMVSLLASPFPKGGSLGERPEVCAIALAANADVNTTAKINFFTIFSVGFRGQRDGAIRGLNQRS
jgi:hypothetical protein